MLGSAWMEIKWYNVAHCSDFACSIGLKMQLSWMIWLRESCHARQVFHHPNICMFAIIFHACILMDSLKIFTYCGSIGYGVKNIYIWCRCWHIIELCCGFQEQSSVEKTLKDCGTSRGHFKNIYEFLNLRALKFYTSYKNLIFQCMGKIFCVESQRYPLKFRTKYLAHTLKDV